MTGHQGIYYNKEGPAFCLIINNEVFPSTNLERREGSSIDVNSIKDELQEREITVSIAENCTEAEIYCSLGELKDPTYEKYRCLIIIILSHGYHRAILSSDGVKIGADKIHCILSADNTPSFRNKPKIIICHTCQKDDEKNEERSGHEKNEERSGHEYFELMEDHFMIVFPALRNCLAYRHTQKGTFYVQLFLKVLRREGNSEDLLSILTIVNRELNAELEAVLEGATQTSVIHTTLTDKVYFKK